VPDQTSFIAHQTFLSLAASIGWVWWKTIGTSTRSTSCLELLRTLLLAFWRRIHDYVHANESACWPVFSSKYGKISRAGNELALRIRIPFRNKF